MYPQNLSSFSFFVIIVIFIIVIIFVIVIIIIKIIEMLKREHIVQIECYVMAI